MISLIFRQNRVVFFVILSAAKNLYKDDLFKSFNSFRILRFTQDDMLEVSVNI